MIFFLLLSILFGSSIAQVPLEHDTTLGEYYPFAVHLPASETAQTGKVPVNVFLHGAGSYGDAGELDTKTLWNGAGKLLLQYYSGNVTPANTLAAESFLTVLPLAPNQTQAGVVPEWNDDGVFNVVQRVFDTYPQVDRTRVYISGYSLGARAAWKLLVERPDLWAAAAISAGEPSNETDWSKLLNIPIRHYVGTEDYEGSSNVGKGETIQSLIEQAGGKLCELVQIPGPEPLPAHNQMAIGK
ncbi:hypothetical protein BT69DRAFT_1346654 [Atractiella rhizophila]|nr:hypothetical protein BT69DRAFT_1346654 [Atractiella rhizophila]